MECVVCGRPGDILFSQMPDRIHPEVPGQYTLKRCPECDLLFVDPPPCESELREHYPVHYGAYQPHKPESRIKSFIIRKVASAYFGYGKSSILSKVLLFPFYFRLSYLPCYVPNGKALDVGCGTGDRMRPLRRLGWEVEGVELDEGAAATARRSTGCKVFVGPVEDTNLLSNRYDVVYLNHVFEHLRDPCRSLMKIGNVLKPGGQLIIVVPNSRSLAFRLFRRHWVWLDIPRHLFTYNGDNLTKLLEKYGFDVMEKVYSHALIDIPGAMAYKLGRPPGAFSCLIWLFWLLSFVADPLGQRLALGGCVTTRAVLKKGRAGSVNLLHFLS